MVLADGVHLALVGADAVLLDGRANLYYCLPGAASVIARAAGEREVRIHDADLVEQLRSAGAIVLTPARTPQSERHLPDRPSTDLAGRAPCAATRRDVIDMAQTYADMLRHYYGRPFADLLSHAARGRKAQATEAVEGPAELCRRANVFARMLPWIPFQGACLCRSFMLLMFLRRGGLDATWVFGVRTWPFEAHCWLQAGDTVLNDTADHLLGYVPLLAV